MARTLKSKKPRKPRATNAEMAERRAAILAIAQRIAPANVRSSFYQAVGSSLVPKDETQGYRPVQKALVWLRENDQLDWDDVIDLSRSIERPLTFTSVAERLELAAQTYRRDLWMDEPTQPIVMIEKQGLGGVFTPVTDEFAVPLLPARGYSSLSFLREGAEVLKAAGKPAHVFYFNDFDPSGEGAAAAAEKRLRQFAPGIKITFKALAVTPAQIARLGLPTRPTKDTDSRSKKFKEKHGDEVGSVELDAMDPNLLRSILRKALERLMPPARYAELMALEEEERAQLRALIDQVMPSDD